MKKSIPYTVSHPYSGQTVKPDRTYTQKREGKWFAFIQVGNIVFKNPQAFDTQLEAQRFCNVTKREGAHIV